MPPQRTTFSLFDKLRDIPVAVLDVETTGASPQWGDRVIEVGILRIEAGRPVSSLQQLVDPQRRIGPGITALTGITQAMVQGQGLFGQVAPRVSELLRGAVLLGHNVRFDLSFLHSEFRRTGQELAEAVGAVRVVDTLRIARRRFGRGGNSLPVLAARLGVAPPTAHRAQADAQTTAAVFEKLLEPSGGWDMCLCDAIQQQGGPMGLMPAGRQEWLLPLALEEALETRGTVQMEYVDAHGARTQRTIRPISIRRSGGHIVLVAYCDLRGGQRLFKLDRVVRLIRCDAIQAEAGPPGASSVPTSGAPW
jgi:DNA polymerase III epsilon subunit family exonuclease